MYFGRGKNKVQKPYTFQHMYKHYLKQIEKESPYDIPYHTYVEICSEYYKTIMNYILHESGRINLPFKMGEMRIRKRKINIDKYRDLTPDWENTLKYKKLIKHINPHTSGYKYKFYWNKKGLNITNLYLYAFVASRDNKRMLAKLIKSNHNDYFE